MCFEQLLTLPTNSDVRVCQQFFLFFFFLFWAIVVIVAVSRHFFALQKRNGQLNFDQMILCAFLPQLILFTRNCRVKRTKWRTGQCINWPPPLTLHGKWCMRWWLLLFQLLFFFSRTEWNGISGFFLFKPESWSWIAQLPSFSFRIWRKLNGNWSQSILVLIQIQLNTLTTVSSSMFWNSQAA